MGTAHKGLKHICWHLQWGLRSGEWNTLWSPDGTIFCINETTSTEFLGPELNRFPTCPEMKDRERLPQLIPTGCFSLQKQDLLPFNIQCEKWPTFKTKTSRCSKESFEDIISIKIYWEIQVKEKKSRWEEILV